MATSISNTNTNSDSAASKSTPELRLTIDVRVSLADDHTGIMVPLGISSDHGDWTPVELGLSARFDRELREALINWLAQGDIAGVSLIDQPEQAVAAVAETRQRCLLLAEQRHQTS